MSLVRALRLLAFATLAAGLTPLAATAQSSGTIGVTARIVSFAPQSGLRAGTAAADDARRLAIRHPGRAFPTPVRTFTEDGIAAIDTEPVRPSALRPVPTHRGAPVDLRVTVAFVAN